MVKESEQSESEKERKHAQKIQKGRKIMSTGSGFSFLETNLMKKKRLMHERIQREQQEKEAEDKLIEQEKAKEGRRQQVRETISKIEAGSTEFALIAIFSTILSEQREERNTIVRALNLIGKQNNRIDDLLLKLIEQNEKLIELLQLVKQNDT